MKRMVKWEKIISIVTSDRSLGASECGLNSVYRKQNIYKLNGNAISKQQTGGILTEI